MKKFAYPLASAIWSAVSEGLRTAKKYGLVSEVKLPARVISVGNIQVGGAGKTPVTAQIASEAIARGLKVCILIRGYGSPWEASGGVLLPGTQANAKLCGDEAALLHDLCPQAAIGVGLNRAAQFYQILENAKTNMDLVILDDGFQHWKIHRDVEVVVVTSSRRTEILFRDWPEAVKRADLLVWTKGEERPATFGKPLVHLKYKIPSAPSSECPYWMVTGIADGKSACLLAEQAGFLIARHISFGDHEPYSEEMVRSILQEALEKKCRVVLTGKDWVKWREWGVSRSEVEVLEPQLEFEEGKDLWSKILWGI